MAARALKNLEKPYSDSKYPQGVRRFNDHTALHGRMKIAGVVAATRRVKRVAELLATIKRA
jgi:hypothetical protein